MVCVCVSMPEGIRCPLRQHLSPNLNLDVSLTALGLHVHTATAGFLELVLGIQVLTFVMQLLLFNETSL